MGAGLELLAGILVDVRGAEEGVDAAAEGSFLGLMAVVEVEVEKG